MNISAEATQIAADQASDEGAGVCCAQAPVCRAEADWQNYRFAKRLIEKNQ
jgi:hypothetical protein